MKMKCLNLFKALMFGSSLLVLSSCGDNEPMGKGDVDFEITDAPSDDASIKGVFVTVSDIKVNGTSLSGFTKQTIDLKAFSEGKTKLLNTTQLDAKSYSNVILVLDLDADENGNAPGCYVLTNENVKFKLKESTSGKDEVTIGKTWAIKANTKNNIVMDFDLRKSIRHTESEIAPYVFVSQNNLNAAVRIIDKQKTGTINGTYHEDESINSDQILVYAYKKGTFNSSVETQGDETDNIQFRNAIASARIKETLGVKTFTLALLEDGDYELHFAAYVKDSETGRFSFTSMLQSETSINGSVSDIIKVHAGGELTLSSTIKGAL
jgi:hypothetical protein